MLMSAVSSKARQSAETVAVRSCASAEPASVAPAAHRAPGAGDTEKVAAVHIALTHGEVWLSVPWRAAVPCCLLPGHDRPIMGAVLSFSVYIWRTL